MIVNCLRWCAIADVDLDFDGSVSMENLKGLQTESEKLKMPSEIKMIMDPKAFEFELKSEDEFLCMFSLKKIKRERLQSEQRDEMGKTMNAGLTS